MSTILGSSVAKAPLSYWVITGLGLLWNLFGSFDYTMTRLRNVDYLKSAGDPQAILTWIDAMPLWAQAGWGLGVWGSLAGSLLMVLRSRHAATAFAVSLVGAVVSFASQYMREAPVGMDTTANKLIPVFIVAIIIALWRYCRSVTARGLMR